MNFLEQSQLAIKELENEIFNDEHIMLETKNINDIIVVNLKDTNRLNALNY